MKDNCSAEMSKKKSFEKDSKLAKKDRKSAKVEDKNPGNNEMKKYVGPSIEFPKPLNDVVASWAEVKCKKCGKEYATYVSYLHHKELLFYLILGFTI